MIKEGEYPYIDRAIRNGITLLTNKELLEYYDKFSEVDKAYKFGIENRNGIKYYVIQYFEWPISLENHNVQISFWGLEQSAKSLSLNIKEYLYDGIEDPYGWLVIDDDKAREIVSLIREDGIRFNTISNNYIAKGEATIEIRYLRPYSEELELAEFKAIYGDIGKSLGGWWLWTIIQLY